MEKNIKDYYDKLASTYDIDRFANSYGQYIHRQEDDFLKKHLSSIITLNLGCGTGRFMEYADYGLDISNDMIIEALIKFPNKLFFVDDADKTNFENNFFNNIFCLHVFMHLPKDKALSVIKESYRILKNKGLFIFDFPSLKRRNILKHKPTNWHGASAYSISEIYDLIKDDWILKCYSGLLFFPIHHIPAWIRKFLLKIDSIICNSFLKEYASYLIIVLEKK